MSFELYNQFATPNLFAALVMFLWIPAVFWIFKTFPSSQAIVISFVTASLFLPEAQLILPGIPDYSKLSAASYAVFIFTVVFDIGRLKQFRFSLLDIPMVVWCISPLLSSLSNNLGFYDGVSSALDHLVIWWIPYFLGRIYLNNLEGLHQLAVGMFAGGIVYIPLCLYEMRMSPQLHAFFYGGHPHEEFVQSIRLGGYRPVVFTRHGLVVGFWMMTALLIGIWLWKTGSISRIFSIRLNIAVPCLFLTFLMIRSTGAYFHLALGLAILYFSVLLRTRWLIYLIVIGIFTYLYLNSMTESSISDQIIEFLSPYLPADRVSSLEFRFDNEDLLTQRANLRPLLGWGGWGRNLIYDSFGKQITIPDSLWIIAFGEQGLVGLASLYSAFLLPVVSLVLLSCPSKLWDKKKYSGASVLTVVLLLYVVETLFNALVYPPFILICGGLTGYVLRLATKVSSQLSQRILTPASVLPTALSDKNITQ